ncbi:hypothetical protein RIF29_38931 [Crotalaria pallida]|uniref:Uncharacterized protein n=1 Tax=Crotalaria pallida TaxID=3830 RepID=A0AAN9HSU6_CROPI
MWRDRSPILSIRAFMFQFLWHSPQGISCCACTYQFDNLSNSRCYIGNLTNLQIVLLQNNNITGPIPSDLGKLSKLQTLDLSNNFFSGEIPSSLGHLKSSNTFTG